jgi:hypothetical protein
MKGYENMYLLCYRSKYWVQRVSALDEVCVICTSWWGRWELWASSAVDDRELQAGLLNIKQNESQFSPPFQNAGLKLHVLTRCKVDRLQLCMTVGDAENHSPSLNNFHRLNSVFRLILGALLLVCKPFLCLLSKLTSDDCPLVDLRGWR